MFFLCRRLITKKNYTQKRDELVNFPPLPVADDDNDICGSVVAFVLVHALVHCKNRLASSKFAHKHERSTVLISNKCET